MHQFHNLVDNMQAIKTDGGKIKEDGGNNNDILKIISKYAS